MMAMFFLDGTGESHQAIKDSTAGLLTSALQTVVEEGTGKACQLDNMPVAGKTGTTTSNKDLWFVGYTPYYTCAVWGGYDDNKECNSDTKFRFRIWKGIMSRVHENLETKDFVMPSSVEQKSVCTISGYLANSSCPSVTEYFATDSLPHQSCPGHKNILKTMILKKMTVSPMTQIAIILVTIPVLIPEIILAAPLAAPLAAIPAAISAAVMLVGVTLVVVIPAAIPVVVIPVAIPVAVMLVVTHNNHFGLPQY